MGKEFSVFDLKRTHSSSLGPPAGSAPAQRFVHTPSTSSPELWSAAAPPSHPGRGKAPHTACRHRLVATDCHLAMASAPLLSGNYQLRVSTLAERPVSPSEEGGGSRSGKGVVFVVRTEL